MAEPKTVARPYAEAAFKIADAAGRRVEWSAMLSALAQVSADARVRTEIGDPSRSAEQVSGLFLSILAGKLDGDAENFVRVLAENGRLELLEEVRGQFDELRNTREGVVEADVYTAFELDAGQLAALVAGLEKRTSDLGITLARWGVPSGPYLVLPLLGPSTVRDASMIWKRISSASATASCAISICHHDAWKPVR